jgi:multidrug efflux pump subunit AcrA (membrane-fusion protein)
MRVAFVLGLLAAASLLTSCSRQQAIQAKQESGPIQVRTAPVVARDVQRVVESVGTLYPFDETVVSAEIDGRVDEVKIDLGDRVSAGEVVVHISDEEQRYLLAQMEAQLRQALERLGLKNEGDKVGDIRETPEPRRARADLFDAEQRYKRARNLVDQGIASQADMDQAEARFKSLQAAYDSTLYQTRNLIQEVERSKAQLDLQRKKLRDATVKAPFAGYVKERQVNVGQYVRVNTPLLTMVKTDPIRLRIEIPERMAPWIRTGQNAQVSLEAYENRTFTGRIWRISPTVDQSKRTFVVEALIDNPNGDLKPGSYARARIPTDKVERIHLVPVRAVTYLFGSNKAYVVKNGDTIEARELKLGDRYEQDVEVLEGIQEGEQVATTQLMRLDTGVKVQVGGSGEPRRGG